MSTIATRVHPDNAETIVHGHFPLVRRFRRSRVYACRVRGFVRLSGVTGTVAGHEDRLRAGVHPRPAQYPANQRKLLLTLLTLLSKRPGNGIKSLARIAVGIWMCPTATPAARRELRAALTDLGYTGRLDDDDRLERALFDVFQPGSRQIRRAVGHPDAPLMVDSMIGVIKARLTAVTRLQEGQVTDTAFYQARHAHVMAYAE